MKLDALKLGLATAVVFTVVWIVCSLLVLVLPALMMRMGGHMLHANLSAAQWTLQWPGFIIGLILWSLLGGVLVWAVAAVYNRLLG